MTDHKAEAEGRLDILNGNDYTGADSEAAVAAQMAQVHATLYLAEQQRIGNLIAFMVQYATSPDDNANFIKYHEKSFIEITKGLGIGS